MNRPGELAEPDLRALRDNGNIPHAQRSARLGDNDCVFYVLYIPDQADFADIDLLQTGFDEAATCIGVVVCELLLHLGEAQSVRDQFIGIHADLVFAGRTAETGNIDDIGDGLEVLFDYPIFDRFQLHHVVVGIRAFQREEVDLADGAPVAAHLWHDTGRQSNLREPLQNPLPVPRILLFIVENQLQVREPEQGERAQVNYVRDAVHRDFQRDTDLLFDLFCGDSGPLGDDVDVVVGNVRIGFHGKLVKRDRSPPKQKKGRREDQKSVVQGKIYKPANHLLLHSVLEHQRILNHLYAGLDARDHFLHASRKRLPVHHFHAPELFVARGDIDPVAIVQMQDGGCRNEGMSFFFLDVKGRREKHTNAHQFWIANLDAHLCCAQRGIENGKHIVDAASKCLVGVSIQVDFGGFADMDTRKIILVDIAHNPHVAQVGNRERIR